MTSWNMIKWFQKYWISIIAPIKISRNSLSSSTKETNKNISYTIYKSGSIALAKGTRKGIQNGIGNKSWSGTGTSKVIAL